MSKHKKIYGQIQQLIKDNMKREEPIPGGKPLGNNFLNSLIEDLLHRARKKWPASEGRTEPNGCRVYFDTIERVLFRVCRATDDSAILTYYHESGSNVEKVRRSLDPELDSWVNIIEELKDAVPFDDRSLFQDHFIDGLLEYASLNLSCEKKYVSEWKTSVIVKPQNIWLFSIEMRKGFRILSYFIPASNGGQKRQNLEIVLGETDFKKATKCIRPSITYCECIKNGIPYSKDFIGKPIAIIKKEWKFHVPADSIVEFDEDANFLKGDYLRAIIPLLKEDGAVYYPSYPLKCKYDWKEGKYALPFSELAGLLDLGTPAVRVVDLTKKAGPKDWAAESILMEHGYTVKSRKTGGPLLSSKMRHAILTHIIESPNINIGAAGVANYLKTFFSNANGVSMEAARKRWLEDYSFVVNKYHLQHTLLKKAK